MHYIILAVLFSINLSAQNYIQESADLGRSLAQRAQYYAERISNGAEGATYFYAGIHQSGKTGKAELSYIKSDPVSSAATAPEFYKDTGILLQMSQIVSWFAEPATHPFMQSEPDYYEKGYTVILEQLNAAYAAYAFLQKAFQRFTSSPTNTTHFGQSSVQIADKGFYQWLAIEAIQAGQYAVAQEASFLAKCLAS